MARLVLPQADGKAAVIYLTSPCGFSMPRMSICSAIQPSFLALVGSDAQRKALFAQQHVAAVAGVDGPDGVVLREVDDVAVLLIDVRFGVQAADKVVGLSPRCLKRLLRPCGS